MKYRVGFGFDVHQLAAGEELILGGVKIPHTTGTVGHSDADAVIHAICDALLGAAGLRDIGYYFPDTDAEWKGADSKILLKKVHKLLQEKLYKIGNVDVTLSLEKPKVKDYIEQMREILAETIDVPVEDITIKAGTNEKMGFVGREEGVAAYAVALVYKD